MVGCGSLKKLVEGGGGGGGSSDKGFIRGSLLLPLKSLACCR